MGRFVVDHEFYCTQCGQKGLPICREGRSREKGHLKILYCLNCGVEVNHVECVPGSKYDRETFLKEFNDGNFGEDGLRKIPLSKWIETQNISETEEEELSVDEWLSIFQCGEHV